MLEKLEKEIVSKKYANYQFSLSKQELPNYLSGELNYLDMYNMLRECGFGYHEANLILNALVITGCKFYIGLDSDDLTRMEE